MTYEDAKRNCHVRSAIYRLKDPFKIFTIEDLRKIHPAIQDLSQYKVGTIVKKLYWKNHQIPLDERVPDEDKLCDDWAEYDPREQPECSEYGETPA